MFIGNLWCRHVDQIPGSVSIFAHALWTDGTTENFPGLKGPLPLTSIQEAKFFSARLCTELSVFNVR